MCSWRNIGPGHIKRQYPDHVGYHDRTPRRLGICLARYTARQARAVRYFTLRDSSSGPFRAKQPMTTGSFLDLNAIYVLEHASCV